LLPADITTAIFFTAGTAGVQTSANCVVSSAPRNIFARLILVMPADLPFGISGVSAREFAAASILYEQNNLVAKIALQVTSRHTCPFVQLRWARFER
jgi:hypothetical protein